MRSPAPVEDETEHRSRQRFSFESVASHSPKYRSDIDGLRAVAVISVLFYHLKIAVFQNGFMGVDVFYVISGYLITSLIAKDLAAGRFSIITFYERRTRRIFPALFTVLFFCTVASFVLLYPEQLTKFGKSLLATTFFVSNLYFWHSALPAGYFDTGVSAQPLLHTWSLAVEEQFYLLFPLTLYVLFRWARKWMSAYLLLICFASFAFSLWTTQHKPVVAFYWLMPRAWELLLGALLATKAFPLLRKRLSVESAALLGIAIVLLTMCLPFKGLPFPGYIALLPCLGTSLVIYAGEAGPSVVSKILSVKPLVFVGVISYSLYLWHWPLIVFLGHFPFDLNGNVLTISVLVFSIVAAFLSFEFIERPFRGSASAFSRRQVFAFGAVASVVAATLSVVAYRTHGLPRRYSPETLELLTLNQQRTTEFNGSCSSFKTPVNAISDIKFCELGSPSQPKVLFFGDSHVEQLYPAIKDIFDRGGFRDHGILTAINDGCLPDENLNNFVTTGYHCDTFTKFTLLRAQRADIDEVFIGFSTWWSLSKDKPFCLVVNQRCGRSLSRDELQDRFLSDLAAEIRVLRDHGKKVIVCLPFPLFRERIPELDMNNAVFGPFGFARTPKETDQLALHDRVRTIALGVGAEVFDPRIALCPDGHCITSVNGVSVYMDNNHLAGSQVQIIENDLRLALSHGLHPQ